MKKSSNLKTILFAVMLLVESGSVWGQTEFSATYTFGSFGNVASFTYNGTTYVGITMGTIDKVGVSTSSNTGNFRATTWPTGATDESDVFTGSVDLGKYIGFTINANYGYKFTLSSIIFGVGRSATGTRQSQWRGSADSYTSILNNYTTLASGLTNSSGVLTNIDANSSWTGNVLSFGSSYSDITSSASCRFYLYNSESTSGTAGLQGTITITGTFEATGGLTSPMLTADASSNDVDNNLDITFTDDATWRTAVRAVKIDGTALTPTTDYVLSSGNLQLIPSGLNALLTTSGSKIVTVEATGYNAASVTQQIDAGTATKLGIKIQPAAPTVNGSTLDTQPAVYFQDQYGNTTTSTATVIATVGIGSWTLGGTTSISASSGTATYSGLTATSVAAFTGATIGFTSDGLTGVTSNSFNIPPPALSLYEDFSYTIGTALTENGWTAHSGSGTNPITVSTGSITYPGYLSSGVGNEVSMATSGEDDNRPIAAQTSGTLYVSFLVNVTSATTGGDYFFHLATNGVGTFIGRIYVKKDASSNLYFGIAQTGTPIYTTTAYTLVTTYLVVLKYTIIHGTANDVAAIYINPELNNVEPSSGWLVNTDTPTDPANVGSVVLRQGGSSTAPALKLDGIRISTNWTDIVGALPTFSGIGDMTETARWSTGSVPGTSANVIIEGDATISANTVLDGITISSGKSLTVNAGKQLTVNTTFTNNGTLNLLSDATGTATILTPATITGSGTYKVQQYLTVARQWWYVSSPLLNATTSTFAPANKIGYYNENGTAYTDPLGVGIKIEVGKGYVVKLSDLTDGIYTFTGDTLNNGDITLNPTRTTTDAAKRGFNLVGNPYPSYLNWELAYTNAGTSNVRSTIWYRTYVSGKMDFQTYNASLGLSIPATVSGYIPPMQGFWVKVDNDGTFGTPIQSTGTIKFTNDMRSHAGATKNLLKAPAVSEKQVVRLVVSNGLSSDETVIATNPNALDTYDSYDSEKMSNNNASIPEIYTIAGTEELAINGLKSITLDEQLPLGFTTGESNTFTIKATEIKNFDSDTRIILKDNDRNTELDLTDGTAYSFISDVDNTASRFSIIFKSASITTGIDKVDNNQILSIYKNENNQVVVDRNDFFGAEGTITVCNAVGQKLVSTQTTGASTVINQSLSSGVYLVTVNVGGKNTTKKLIIN